MTEKMQAIEKNSTWELVHIPEGKNVVGLKWVFRTKYNADRNIQKQKARVVDKGYSRFPGIDSDDTFSPIAQFKSVRVMLALAAQMQLPVYQFDVKSTFLNGDMEEEFYVSQPKGFVINGSRNKVYRLRKALYWLKQAPLRGIANLMLFFTIADSQEVKMSPLFT